MISKILSAAVVASVLALSPASAAVHKVHKHVIHKHHHAIHKHHVFKHKIFAKKHVKKIVVVKKK